MQTAESDEIQLSQKHKLILELAARGFANKEIAARTQTSESSVKLAMSIIFEKLYAANRSHAVARAYELGILKVGELADALQ